MARVGKTNERQRTANTYNLDIDITITGEFGIPKLKPCDAIPDELIGFNYVMSSKPKANAGIHFFIDDYQFERVWRAPEKYIDKFRKYKCVLTPDFSLYTDMSLAIQIWNVYRSRTIGAYLQNVGLNVIPTLQWSDSRSYCFAFDGLPKNSTVAVSAIGVNRNHYSRMLWLDGIDEAIQRLTPERIFLYGEIPEYQFPESIEVVRFKPFVSGLRDRTRS